MTFLRLKLNCGCTFEGSEMKLVEDDMAWTFMCPKCSRQVSVENWTSNDVDAEEQKKTKGEKP